MINVRLFVYIMKENHFFFNLIKIHDLTFTPPRNRGNDSEHRHKHIKTMNAF